MAELNTISPETWKKLISATRKLRELAPWEWMLDVDVFAFVQPETGEMGFCSIRGANKNVLGLAVYKSRKGFTSFEAFFEMDSEAQLEAEEMYQDCLMLSFHQKADLLPEDLAFLESNGFEFEGNFQWPEFRDYTPGQAPWKLESESQALLLLTGIEQTLEIATRFKEDPELLDNPEEDVILTRTPELLGGEYLWKDKLIKIGPYIASKPNIKINKLYLLSNCSGLPRKNKSWLIDVFYFPTPIGKEGARPYYPQMLIVVDLNTLSVIGHDLFRQEGLSEKLQESLVTIIQHQKSLPEKIVIPNYETYLLLEDFSEILQIILEIDEDITFLSEIKSSLFGSLSI